MPETFLLPLESTVAIMPYLKLEPFIAVPSIIDLPIPLADPIDAVVLNELAFTFLLLELVPTSPVAAAYPPMF